MKNRVMQGNVSVVRKGFFYSTLLALLLINVIPQKAIAQGVYGETPTAATIKYLGFVEDKLLFNVDIENKAAERCIITIQDEQGEILFRQDFKEARYAKTFGINKEEVDGRNLVFVLIKGKERHEQAFQVSTSTRIVQDVVVAKQ
jgi:hypothetical protein